MGIVQDLDRLEIGKMDDIELDAGFARAIGLPVRESRVYIGGERFVEALRDGVWGVFTPTGNWNDFGYAVSRMGGGLVLGVHRDAEKGEVSYYSAHAYLSGTTQYSKSDLRVAAAKAATAYGRLMGWKDAAPVVPAA